MLTGVIRVMIDAMCSFGTPYSISFSPVTSCAAENPSLKVKSTTTCQHSSSSSSPGTHQHAVIRMAAEGKAATQVEPHQLLDRRQLHDVCVVASGACQPHKMHLSN